MKQSKIFIYGRHAVAEALEKKPECVRKIHLAPGMDDRYLRDLIKRSGVPIEPLDERKATSQAEGNAPHQGVIALVSLSGLLMPFERFLTSLAPTPSTCLVFLSEVQDPHNVGAIIRSAAAFGASAVLFSDQNQAPITGTVVKASAGAAFTLPLVEVPGTQQSLSALKKKGFVVYGLAGEGSASITAEKFEHPTLLVLGNEAEGIAPAARALCDTMLSIPITNKTESLNVAAASAVALYAWSVAHKSSLS